MDENRDPNVDNTTWSASVLPARSTVNTASGQQVVFGWPDSWPQPRKLTQESRERLRAAVEDANALTQLPATTALQRDRREELLEKFCQRALDAAEELLRRQEAGEPG